MGSFPCCAAISDPPPLYYALPDGSSVRRVADHIIGPNGVGLSPDGGHVYVAETYTACVWWWQVGAEIPFTPAQLWPDRARNAGQGWPPHPPKW